MKKLFILFIVLFTYSFSLYAEDFPHNNESFFKAKKQMKQVYYDNQFSFYCDCIYEYKQENGREKTIVYDKSCGYTPRKNKQRGKYIEWEHIMPAYRFASHLECWNEEICLDKKGKPYKGRKCCEKVDKSFRIMQADMYNLVPSVGELNGDRSNYEYGIIEGETRVYGECDFEVSKKLAEPKEDIRGDIARTYFYMEETYGITLTDEERQLFIMWDKMDNISQWEKIRAERIKEIQGNENKFIK